MTVLLFKFHFHCPCLYFHKYCSDVRSTRICCHYDAFLTGTAIPSRVLQRLEPYLGNHRVEHSRSQKTLCGKSSAWTSCPCSSAAGGTRMPPNQASPRIYVQGKGIFFRWPGSGFFVKCEGNFCQICPKHCQKVLFFIL